MQLVKKIVPAIGVIWIFLLIFMPKTELYFLLEKKLVEQDIQINEAKIDERLFSLDIQKATIFYKGIPVASAKSANIFSVLAYSRVLLKDIEFDALLASSLPQKVQILKLTHSVLDPIHLLVWAKGSFGTVKGNFDLKSKKLHLDFVETKEIDNIRESLQKDQKGYYYEISF